MKQFNTVEDYIASKAEQARLVLEQVRDAIRSALPDAEESISYNIPTYKVHGRPVIYLGGWKRHFSIYPSSANLEATFKDELAPYEVEKGTIRFPLSEPPPLKLISDLAIFRRQEVEAKRAASVR